MKYPLLTLKPDAEVHLRNHHHAIFRSAVDRLPQAQDGDIVEVKNSRGDFLCYAHWNQKAYICGRAIAFEKGDPLAHVRTLMEQAVRLRTTLFAQEETTCFRLINAEGDALPGLIVDQYGDVLVIQLTTLGFDRMRDWVIEQLMDIIRPRAIFEKSTGPARKKEGLEEKEDWVHGKTDDAIAVKERGLQYLITLEGSQKTGLFLDQREMRSLVRQTASGRTVLDCCSYVGGFSVNALAGGARASDAVDYDSAALARAREHAAINGLPADRLQIFSEDVFAFLRRTSLPHRYDFVILDPPAFAKRSADLEPAKKAYTDLNRMALQTLPPGGLLLTCSCSYQVNPELFQTIVFHAARQAKRAVKILSRHRQAMDHPVNLYHPEGDYLKSLLLWVE
ncbi:MAG: class I SAM-dependent rRNA methyltransferase [Candidatus Peribacteraceae bacterium]|nr:class I SAM-dependent rRNA methyltransferase [Candidatus Peribacteraceae bacterium]MDD5742896.1 class I SAM-dependent rRNA methyltransferase [Candidatus Peribacteraceae bacterium]